MQNANSNPTNESSSKLSTYACWGFLGLTCCAAPLTFIFYLFSFAFYNPDNLAWVGKNEDGEFQMYGSVEEASTAVDVEDVHYNFQFFFSKGFMLFTVIPVIIIGFIGIC